MYKILEKLSYEDEEKYIETYHSRYHNEVTYHLPIKIRGNPAFFLINPDVCSLLIEIYKKDKTIAILRQRLPPVAIKQFTTHSLVDEILLTNNIEGVHSTRREIEDVLDSLREKDRQKRFQGLVQKYYLLQSADTISLREPKDIRDIYNELTLNEVREANEKNVPDGHLFRKGQVSVDSPAGKELHRGLYPEKEIIDALSSALAILNDETINALCRVSVFHYLFGYIHPFYDGNGRTSRFISSYLLSKELDPLVGYRLSYTIKESIEQYYKAFRVCNNPRNRADLTPFLLMFLETILRSVKQLIDALSARLEKWHYYRRICFETLSPDEKLSLLYDVLIQASLFGSKGISIEELTETLEISKSTLAKRLSQIAPPELLHIETESRRKFYSLELPVLDKLYQGIEIFR